MPQRCGWRSLIELDLDHWSRSWAIRLAGPNDRFVAICDLPVLHCLAAFLKAYLTVLMREVVGSLSAVEVSDEWNPVRDLNNFYRKPNTT